MLNEYLLLNEPLFVTLQLSSASLQKFVVGNSCGKPFFFLKNKLFIYLFIYLCLCWVFTAARGLSLVAARGATLRCGAQASHCGGFSCCGAWALGAQASVVVAHRLQRGGSVVVAHGLSCSVVCGTFPDQGSNPSPLHWQADS